MQKSSNRLKQFLALESTSGMILIIMAMLSMIWANSTWAPIHQQFVDTFLFWINEGLMSIFFLLVGLELKRSYLEGFLGNLSQILLPIVTAIFGMMLPAFIYIAFNYHNPNTLRGWATPVATDIAFALGVLSLFSRNVPTPLKLFLLSVAIFDDIGAIIIIGLFFSHGIAYLYCFQAIILLVVLYLLNRLRVNSAAPYLILGAWLWLQILNAGLHPTISGVLLALMIPGKAYDQRSLSYRLERKLHPLVAYLILPCFALVNAGVSLQGLSMTILFDTVVLGIALGLFLGKQIGVMGSAFLLIKTGLAKLPEKTNWLQFYGVAILCGIGFTMSLFLGTLSFQNEPTYLAEVRLGVIIGSLLSAAFGVLILSMTFFRAKRT